MTYAVLSAVKSILQIDAGETGFDTEILSCIKTSDALVDSLLKARGLTVPTPTPQNVVDCSNYFAAWAFRRKRDPVGAEAFWSEAQRFLDAYVRVEDEVEFRMV